MPPVAPPYQAQPQQSSFHPTDTSEDVSSSIIHPSISSLFQHPPAIIKLTDSIKRVCIGILTSIQRHQNSGPFLFPMLPTEWNSAYDLNEQNAIHLETAPSSLQSSPRKAIHESATKTSCYTKHHLEAVQEKLEQGVYNSTNEFFLDLHHVFTLALNAWRKGSSVHSMAQSCEKYLFIQLKKLPKKQKIILGLCVDADWQKGCTLDEKENTCPPPSAQVGKRDALEIDTQKTFPVKIKIRQSNSSRKSCRVDQDGDYQMDDDEVSTVSDVQPDTPISPDAIESSSALPIERPSLKHSRICAYCATKVTPMWRHGPPSHDPLCNSCGVKWRRGRILTEFKRSTQVAPKRKAISHLRISGDIVSGNLSPPPEGDLKSITRSSSNRTSTSSSVSSTDEFKRPESVEKMESRLRHTQTPKPIKAPVLKIKKKAENVVQTPIIKLKTAPHYFKTPLPVQSRSTHPLSQSIVPLGVSTPTLQNNASPELKPHPLPQDVLSRVDYPHTITTQDYDMLLPDSDEEQHVVLYESQRQVYSCPAQPPVHESDRAHLLISSLQKSSMCVEKQFQIVEVLKKHMREKLISCLLEGVDYFECDIKDIGSGLFCELLQVCG